MKKDVFKGKIKSEHIGTLYFSIVFAAVIYLACAILFLCLGLFYNKVEYVARIVLYVVSGVCFLLAVIYPITTVICVRTYPKYKKLTCLLVKPYFLNDEEQKTCEEQQTDNEEE